MNRIYRVVRLNKDGSVGYDYGSGDSDWMINMFNGEINYCEVGDSVKVIVEEEMEDEEEE